MSDLRLFDGRQVWLYYYEKTKPEHGESPDVNDYVKAEKQYELISDMLGPDIMVNEMLPEEPHIDRALDKYNDHKEEWKNGQVLTKSISIAVDYDGSLQINKIETLPGFVMWTDESLVNNIKNFISVKA